MSTPEGVPEDYQYLEPGESPPPGAEIVESDHGAEYYKPPDRPDDVEPIGDRANADGTIDVAELEPGDEVLKDGERIGIQDTVADDNGTAVLFNKGREEFFIYDDLIGDLEVPNADELDSIEDDVDAGDGDDGDGSGDDTLVGEGFELDDGTQAEVLDHDPETGTVVYQTEDGEEDLITEGYVTDEEADDTAEYVEEFRDRSGLSDVGVNLKDTDPEQRERIADAIGEFDDAVGLEEMDVRQVTDQPMDDVGANAGAAYQGSSRTLYVNPDGLDEENKQLDFENGYIATETPEGSIYHELVHARHFSDTLSDEGLDFGDLREEQFDPEEAEAVRDSVSDYAAVNPTEFVAEVGSGVVEGQSYPDVIMDLYEQYGGPEVESV